MIPGFKIEECDLPRSEEDIKEVENFPYQKIIGSLWWLAGISRPDICMATHFAATWSAKPSIKLRKLLMRILKYLASTKNVGLCFQRTNSDISSFEIFVDASFASEQESKSRYGYLFFYNGCLISWTSRRCSRIMSSSTEAECNGLVQAGKENIWEREFHSVLDLYPVEHPTVVFQDNMSAIKLASGVKVSKKRSGHFGIDFDLFREYVALEEMKIEHRNGKDLPADMLTKALPLSLFAKYRDYVMGGENAQRHFETKGIHSSGLMVHVLGTMETDAALGGAPPSTEDRVEPSAGGPLPQTAPQTQSTTSAQPPIPDIAIAMIIAAESVSLLFCSDTPVSTGDASGSDPGRSFDLTNLSPGVMSTLMEFAQICSWGCGNTSALSKCVHCKMNWVCVSCNGFIT